MIAWVLLALVFAAPSIGIHRPAEVSAPTPIRSYSVGDRAELRWTHSLDSGVPDLARAGKMWLVLLPDPILLPWATPWADSTGILLAREDSIEVHATAAGEFEGVRQAVRLDNYLKVRGNLLVHALRADTESPTPDSTARITQWALEFQPTVAGFAGMFDSTGAPFPFHMNASGEQFRSKYFDPLPATMKANARYFVRDENWLEVGARLAPDLIPVKTVQGDFLLTGFGSAHFQGLGSAQGCSGWPPPGTELSMPKHFVTPFMLFAAHYCLTLDHPPAPKPATWLQRWGLFSPGNLLELDDPTQVWIHGRFTPSPGLAAGLGAKPLAAKYRVKPWLDRKRQFQLDSAATQELIVFTDSSWIPSPKLFGFGQPVGFRIGLRSDQPLALATYAGVLEAPAFWTRLDTTAPIPWRGRHATLSEAAFQLDTTGRAAIFELVWTPVVGSSRLKADSGWTVQARRALLPRLHQTPQGMTIEVSLQQRHYREGFWLAHTGPRTSSGSTPPSTLQSEADLDSVTTGALPPPPNLQGRAKIRIGSRTLAVDRTMATVQEYAQCVASRTCSPVITTPLPTSRERRWSIQAGWEESVQTGLDSTQARDYCRFRGGRLPTLREWRLLLESGGRKGIAKELERFGASVPQEHFRRSAPFPPAQMEPWSDGLYDLIGNGPVWCQGALCSTGMKRFCTLGTDDTGCESAPEFDRRSPGVRCVADSPR